MTEKSHGASGAVAAAVSGRILRLLLAKTYHSAAGFL